MKLSIPVQPSKCKATASMATDTFASNGTGFTSLLIGKLNCMHRMRELQNPVHNNPKFRELSERLLELFQEVGADSQTSQEELLALIDSDLERQHKYLRDSIRSELVFSIYEYYLVREDQLVISDNFEGLKVEAKFKRCGSTVSLELSTITSGRESDWRLTLTAASMPQPAHFVVSDNFGALNQRKVREAFAEFQYATRRFLDRQIELQKDLP